VASTLREAERVIGWLGVALSPIAAACLGAAAWFGPAAIGAGAHLQALGVTPRTCPGCALCGLSRAFAWAIEGEWSVALDQNPLVVVCFPVFVAFSLSPIWLLTGRWKSP